MPALQWQSTVRFNPNGPGVTVLHESTELKVVLVGLRAGQGLPVHAGPAASFLFLDGDAVMVVGDDEVQVRSGRASRAVRAVSDVVFLGNLGDPGSEQGPH